MLLLYRDVNQPRPCYPLQQMPPTPSRAAIDLFSPGDASPHIENRTTPPAARHPELLCKPSS